MNNLNSVLLEGTISGKPCVAGKGATKRCSFVIASLRYVPGRVSAQETRIWVMVRNSDRVKAALEHAYDGRGLRVVGWLASDEDGGICIEAEHIEYRPELKRK
jgi:hypothetical protein